MEVNERCDVYSFGVLTLEVIMGKHPGDLIYSLSSSSFSSSSTSTAHGIFLKDVLDQRLAAPENQVAEQVFVVAKLAFACLQANPLSRPTMRQVAMKLSDDRRPPRSRPRANELEEALAGAHMALRTDVWLTAWTCIVLLQLLCEGEDLGKSLSDSGKIGPISMEFGDFDHNTEMGIGDNANSPERSELWGKKRAQMARPVEMWLRVVKKVLP
ncbi:putative leucine-rich repeat receptor-like protein kinase [Camellia lanceoleosa]|uniref:Leucine-rich repeat receptor-like protein kinase n=1 Tax=Camellia lanceoleosa TaxID=1840588 RepID=A0ACC0GRU5_9ERIC|nr:putative leucine-rich repeat receptor-like protein kinase [Camellia lanceoleosa]